MTFPLTSFAQSLPRVAFPVDLLAMFASRVLGYRRPPARAERTITMRP